jgi:hypothetical protein
MSTESEIILARYKAVEKEADAFGRVIGVRRLKPSEQTAVAGFCSDLSGYDEVVGPGCWTRRSKGEHPASGAARDRSFGLHDR